MIVTLRVAKGEDAGKVFHLADGEAKAIGRSSQADIILTDATVSREHCRVRIEAGACYVLDLGSRNGTWVNGKRVKAEVRVGHGDLIGIGTTLAEAHIEAGPEARELELAAGTEAPRREVLADDTEDSVVALLAKRAALAVPENSERTVAKNELALQDEPASLVGTIVGGYRIEGLMRQHGNSCIYRATQISMERLVALKILSHVMNSDQRSVERFILAARAGGKLNHPNIVRVYDAGEERGFYFVAMEFVGGISVRQLLAERGRSRALKLPQAVWIAEQIAGALDYAHSLSVIHGRVTADTIFVTAHEVAKLGELGFAESDLAASCPKRLKPEERLDEAQFTAPELLAGARSATPQCDIYSLSIILFLMVTGQMPFRGTSEKELLEKIRRGQHEPVRRLQRSVPDVLAQIIERGLAASPAQRYSHAADLQAALQQATEGMF